MAVNIVSQPSDFQTLADCNEWELELTSPGIAPEVKQLAYQIQKDNGDPISEIEIVPYTGQPHKINVTRELERIMINRPPLSGVERPIPQEGTAEELGLIIDYKIVYGEATTNTDTCTTVVDLGSTTTIKTALNGYKALQNDLYNGIFTNKPVQNRVVEWQDDWILLADLVTPYTVKVYVIENGIKTLEHTQVFSPGVHFFGCGPKNLLGQPDLASASAYEVEVTLGASVIETFVFTIESCSKRSFLEVVWKEPIGGWSSIVFEDNNIGASGGQLTSFNKSFPCSLNNSWPSYYSSGVILNQENLQPGLSLSKAITYQDKIEHWIWGLLGSNNVYMNYFVGSSKVWIRANIQNKAQTFKELEDSILRLDISLANPIPVHQAY